MHPRDRLIVALDLPTPDQALAAAAGLRDRAGLFKVGLELFCSAGPEVVRRLGAGGSGVFLDLKLHDIPRTVERAVASCARSGARMLTLHMGGGPAMAEAAARAARAAPGRPRLLGVTVLTSFDRGELAAVGVPGTVQDQVVRLARMARDAGLDGVVASPHEIAAIKEACGPAFLVVTPGVRPAGWPAGDQRRTMTPREAVAAGADYLVVGRPILEAPDPAAAASALVEEMRG
ncbi:MAG TPA: orotidine-5'-phosphate decarboxylase [Candidatus Polarisedimenticolia bacterium]|nr:orotidine-5'-phosphate decarboxylase [Candidatus Polarisedimenticolia bacterium]